jgi:DNA-binding NtrC family response regulator
VQPPGIFNNRRHKNIIHIKLERRTGNDRRSGHERRKSVRKRGKKTILVLDANKKQCRQLCKLITNNQYKAIPLYLFHDLEKTIEKSGCLAIFWDIDTVPVENRIIRDLTIKFPGVYFFGLSRHQFHPELQDAICYHIYACINRPIDADELFYWLRSIHEDEVGAENQGNK